MSAAHTPGPWTVEGDGIRALVRGADATIVAVRHRLPAAVHVANAALIAKAPIAPKLAEALRMAFDAHSYPAGQRPAWYDAAIEALAEWEAQ